MTVTAVGLGDRPEQFLIRSSVDPLTQTCDDTSQIERIEAAKGPASVLYGSGWSTSLQALSGSISHLRG